MKTKWKLFIWLMAPVFILISCEPEAIDPLTGIYTAPDEYDFTVLESQSRAKDGTLYIFSINLSDAESNTMNLKLVAANYILPASDFTASDTTIKNTYLTGIDGSTCNGQEITSGTLTILQDSSNYTMNGILYLADESVAKITAAFTVIYEPDPYVPTYTYEIETETPALGGAQGTTPINGATKNKITVYADGILYAYFEVIADENAASLSGTYSIKDGIDAVGQVNNGFYLDWSWWGGEGILEGGSYYIEADVKMFLREGDGDIIITDNSGTLTITGENLGILDVDALIASSGATWTVLDTPGSVNIENATLVGGETSSLTYENEITAPATYGWAGTIIEGSQLNTIKIVNADNDTVARFELITAEGISNLTGDYSVKDGTVTAMEIGDANNGFYLDLSWYGQSGEMIGGCYYTENDELQYIRAGSTLHVEDNSGVLTITGSDLALLDVDALISSSGATWTELPTTGSCSYTDVSPAGSGGDDGVELTNLFGATALDNSLFGGTGYTITLKISTDGITATYNEATWSYTYTGSGNFISLDFSRDDATLPAGTYNVVSNATAAVGDCIAGYDSGFGSNWGCVWGTVTDGAASDIIINSGTVEVSIDGDNYTIAADVSTDEGNVKASYTGPIELN